MDLGMFIESNGYMEQYAYTLCYLNASNYAFFRQQCLIIFEAIFELFWYATFIYTTTLIAHIDWLFYCCSLYMQYTAHKSMSIWHKQASLSLGSIYHQCALHFFNAETHFAWFKAIHNTSVTIMGLSLQLTLFETGIKVVDLLTPYKKGFVRKKE